MMLPLLKILGDQKEHLIKTCVDELSSVFSLTDEEKNLTYPTKRVRIFYDRLQWSITYLKSAGLLSRTRRGFIQITNRGLSVLEKNPSQINNKYLRQFPEFLEFSRGSELLTSVSSFPSQSYQLVHSFV